MGASKVLEPTIIAFLLEKIETSRSRPPQQINVTIPKRSFVRDGEQQPRRGGVDVVKQKNFTRSNLSLPEKLALRLVFRLVQLCREGNSGGDHRDVSENGQLKFIAS